MHGNRFHYLIDCQLKIFTLSLFDVSDQKLNHELLLRVITSTSIKLKYLNVFWLYCGYCEPELKSDTFNTLKIENITSIFYQKRQQHFEQDA